MICNIFNSLTGYFSPKNEERISQIEDVFVFDLDHIGYSIQKLSDGTVLCVEKDPAAIAVADIVEPVLADEIIRYNAHLLKGDISEKKKILKSIADALEPRRKDLEAENKSISNDFFFIANNCDIRHNNCDPTDNGKYFEAFAKFSNAKKEALYDDAYQVGLLAFLTLENVDRHKEIEKLKRVR